MCTSVLPAFSSRNAVSASLHSLWTRGIAWVFSRDKQTIVCAAVKVLTGHRRFNGRTVVEVVEHQVHVRSLLPLQVVYDGLVTMHFNLDVGFCLPGQSTWFVELPIGTPIRQA